MRRTALVLLLVAACVGVTGYAQGRTDARTVLIGSGYMTTAGGARIAADHMEVKQLVGNASDLESVTFQGRVTITQNGVTVKADEAIYNQATRELSLTGNVRMVVADMAPSAK